MFSRVSSSVARRRLVRRSRHRALLLPARGRRDAPERVATLEPAGEANRPDDTRHELPCGHALRPPHRVEELARVDVLGELGRSRETLVPRLAPSERGGEIEVAGERRLTAAKDSVRQE